MRALIMTGRYVTDVEYTYCLHRLREDEWEVHVATPGKETVYGVIGEKVVPTHDIAQITVTDYRLLILPGGARAMEYLRQDYGLISMIRLFHLMDGVVIGSICHAAQLLISAKLVKGRDISGYYSLKDDIINAGGRFVDAPYVVCDGIVSSPHYKHLGPWMKRVLLEVQYRDNPMYNE